MENYDSLIAAINGLKLQGYTEDFKVEENCIICHNALKKIHPHEFEVDKYFRFEENTDPSDQSIIYAISSEEHHIKGILINSYGLYSDDLADEILKKLKV